MKNMKLGYHCMVMTFYQRTCMTYFLLLHWVEAIEDTNISQVRKYSRVLQNYGTINFYLNLTIT